MTIPVSLKVSISGAPFLTEARRQNEYLLFCTPENLTQLCLAAIICLDGTLIYVPVHMLTIHAFDGDKLLPLAYCLMSSKAAASYSAIFNILKAKAVTATATRVRSE